MAIMELPFLGGLLAAWTGLSLLMQVVLCVGVLASFGIWIFYLGYPRPLYGIPYNITSSRRWLGDVPDFQKHFAETGEGWDWLALQAKKLNSRPAIVQVFLGPYQKPTVVLVDQVEIRDITTRRGADFDRGGFLTRWLSTAVPNGTISMPSHPRFKAQRAAWQGTMSTEFVHRVFAPQLHRHASEMIRRWSAKASVAQGKPFEANADIRVTIFEMVWSAAFGNDLHTMASQTDEYLRSNVEIKPDEAKFPVKRDEGILKSVIYLVDTLEKTRITPFPVIHHWLYTQTSTYKQAHKDKKDTIRGLLKTSKAKFETNKADDSQVTCAMDFVYRRQQSEKLKPATDEDMEDELIVFLVGGFESSQWNTSWGLKHLTANPSAQAALREELTRVFPGCNANNMPDAKAVVTTKLPYVDATVEEILRLARSNAGALRIAVRDTTIYNYHIPKGTDLFGVHTAESAVIELPPRPQDWNPGHRAGANKGKWEKGSLQKFQPERWLKKAEDGSLVFDNNSGPFMAFGTGVRSCFGQRLARTTLRVLVVMLFLAFEFDEVTGDKASFAAEEKLVRMAKLCYVNLMVRE